VDGSRTTYWDHLVVVSTDASTPTTPVYVCSHSGETKLLSTCHGTGLSLLLLLLLLLLLSTPAHGDEGILI
jgi:hypothetical protein